MTENATDNTNTTEVTTTVADTAGEAAISYASSKLRLHDDTEDCGFEGMIDAYIELFDESVVVGDTVHYCGTGNKRTVVPENAERFYYAYGKNVVVGNSDGTYALCQEDAIYPFVIEACEQIGELKQFEKYLDDVYYVVDANGKLYSGIQDRVSFIREYGNSEIGDEYGECVFIKKSKG